ELKAHYLGAKFQTGLADFTLLDMGGQDYKVMRIERERLADMATNDKCAASTGRYIENMAGVLGISTEEMGLYHKDPVKLTTTCAIFGESELIGLVVKGEPVSRLAAGVNRAVVERVIPLLARMGDGIIVMSGGVALNCAVVTLLGRITGREVRVPGDPLHNGAIGCCLCGGTATL
ncbi:MAG: 2-hydroxyglutaryl-CoA dehydratase, partial [Candidatus Latescibacteria bacterium]|nr:2-hydroxyglutaryl-CoA dehydratase [Candidatus Latescibacterota bacterium]